MKADLIIANPPYHIGGKVIAKCKETEPNADFSVLMPLAQYKNTEVNNHKLYEYINDIEFVGGDGFDASITNNNCIANYLNKASPEHDYNYFWFKSFDQRYLEFYLYNIKNYRGLVIKEYRNGKLSTFNIDTDFIETTRYINIMQGSGYHNKNINSSIYRWNILKDKNVSDITSLAVLHFDTAKAKENYCKYAYNYTTDKYNCLESKILCGINMTSISLNLYFIIPQINWNNIHISQKELWDKQLYDEAVLNEMGLKWCNDTIVKNN